MCVITVVNPLMPGMWCIMQAYYQSLCTATFQLPGGQNCCFTHPATICSNHSINRSKQCHTTVVNHGCLITTFCTVHASYRNKRFSQSFFRPAVLGQNCVYCIQDFTAIDRATFNILHKTFKAKHNHNSVK